jgi:hypothetical protein
MSTNPPRGFQFLRTAIATVVDLGELGRVREFAREQWADDPEIYPQLEALLDQRQAELEGRPGVQMPLPRGGCEELDRDAG